MIELEAIPSNKKSLSKISFMNSDDVSVSESRKRSQVLHCFVFVFVFEASLLLTIGAIRFSL